MLHASACRGPSKSKQVYRYSVGCEATIPIGLFQAALQRTLPAVEDPMACTCIAIYYAGQNQ